MKRKLSFFVTVFILSAVNLTAQILIQEKKPAAGGRHDLAGALFFLPDDLHLVSYNEKDLRIRNLETWTIDSIEPPFKWERSYIRNVVATHDGSKIIIEVSGRYRPKKNRSVLGGGGDTLWQYETTLLCYSVPGKKLLWDISTGTQSNDALLVSPGDNVLCAVAHMGRNKFIDPGTGKMLASGPSFPNGDGENIVQSLDGKLVLFWDRPGFKTVNIRKGSHVELWDFDKGKVVGSKFIEGKGVWAAAFAKDSKRIFTGSFDGSLQEWSLTDDQLTLLRKDSGAIANLSCPATTGGGLAVKTFRNDRLSVYSLSDMKPIVTFLLSDDTFRIGGGGPSRFSLSNDGLYFGLYHRDGTISVYRTDDWQLVRDIE